MAYEQHDYASRPLTRSELDDILMDTAPQELVSSRSPTFRRLGIPYEELTAEQAIELMLEHNTIVRRPVVRWGKKRIVGLDPDAYEALAKELETGLDTG